MNLINSGRITVESPVAYSVLSSNDYTYIQYTGEPSVVPEPATLGAAVLGVGLAALLAVRRRRRAA